MMLGLIRPDSGSVSLFGSSPTEAVDAGVVGGMLQTGSLPGYLNVRELVTMMASLYPHPLSVDDVLRSTGILEIADRPTTKLSGGQTQRVRMAIALVADPDLLVLDEPTAALDVEGRRDFWTAIRAVAARGKTIVFATHYLEEADAYADRIVLMARGQIVADGPPIEIKARVGGRTIRVTLPGVELSAVQSVTGVTASRAARRRLRPHLRRFGVIGRRLARSARSISLGPRHRSPRRRTRRGIFEPHRRRRGREDAVKDLTYVRYEVLRTIRNRRFLIFSLIFPLILFFAVAGAHRHVKLDGISFPLYYMTGMASWGAMTAVISSGARIAQERQVGWTRQLRITPLTTSAYFTAKVLTGYLMAIFSIVVLAFAGTLLGVRLDATGWLTMLGLLLVGLIPFAVMGIMLGHLISVDSLGPAIGGITSLFALFGGVFGQLFTSGAVFDGHQVPPLLLARPRGQVGARGRSYLDGRSLDRDGRVDARARSHRRTGVPPRHGEGLEPRELPDRTRERRVVIVAKSLGDEPIFEGCRQRRDGQRRTDAVRELEADPEILSVQRDLEAERIVVVDHATAAIFEHPRTSGPALDG